MFQREIGRVCEGIKPGWVRVGFNYFLDKTTFDYMVEAVQLISNEASSLLTWYRFEPCSGLWRHRNDTCSTSMGPSDPDFDGLGQDELPAAHQAGQGQPLADVHGARPVDHRRSHAPPLGTTAPQPTTGEFEQLRWFSYAGEARRPFVCAVSSSIVQPIVLPIVLPNVLPRSGSSTTRSPAWIRPGRRTVA